MDINLARTFLIIAETGSFIDAARRMNVAQSTVSARMKTLEDLLGQPLFERSKTGAGLTAAGNQFQKHALALVRVWQHAQLEVGIAEQHRDHLAVGATTTLWDGFLLRWVGSMRELIPDIAITSSAGDGPVLIQRLVEGTLDLAVLYRPAQPPGFLIEHLFDEELVLVSASDGGRREKPDYVFIDWGPEFQADHAAAFPEFSRPGLKLDLGSLGVDYLLQGTGSAYLPMRLVKTYVSRGRLRIPKGARKFVSPVYMVYPEARDEEAYEPILQLLRRIAAKLS
jgi:DNA-binding transcriptional LysR family regulator